MDLPILTTVAHEVLETYRETKFRWLFQDRYHVATFQAFFANEWERRKGEHPPTATLLLSQAGEVKDPWSHVFDVHESAGTLWMNAYFGDQPEDIRDLVRLKQVLHIEGRSGGEPWKVKPFLDLMDVAAGSVPGNWPQCRIVQAEDIPERLRRDIDNSKALYYLYTKAWHKGKGQSDQNHEKTSRLIGVRYADECKRLHASTCWTDDPHDKRIRDLPVSNSTVILD